MASSSASLDSTMPYTGSDHVTVANGNILNISILGNASITKDIDLLDVLVVPKLIKNLLSISKLTADSPVDILFSHDMFTIQNRHTKDILANGRCENGLYVLKQGHKALVACLKSNRLCASYELWHSRLGHVSFNTISLLNKLGHFSVTSLLPRTNVCSPCELSKSHRLPFLLIRRVKAFQSDGGTEFLNQCVKQLLVENGTHHRISCPYTPEQNGRAERKHRHVTETGLAMLFNSNAPASLWVDAFTSAVYIINCLPTKLLNNKSPFELLFNRAPNYDIFRAFGCQAQSKPSDSMSSTSSSSPSPCHLCPDDTLQTPPPTTVMPPAP
ncbi:retrovirus-related pol polyprotein from transposon TNT 1-94 [Tanacetum coccineum]